MGLGERVAPEHVVVSRAPVANDDVAAPLLRDVVPLDLASPAAHVLVDPAHGRLERIADRDVDIFVSVVLAMLVIDDDLFAARVDRDLHRVQVSFATVLVGERDRDAAARELVAESLERARFVSDPFFDRRRRLHSAKGDA